MLNSASYKTQQWKSSIHQQLLPSIYRSDNTNHYKTQIKACESIENHNSEIFLCARYIITAEYGLE